MRRPMVMKSSLHRAPGLGTGDNVIDFLGKSITVRSSNGPDVTIIDGQSARRGVAFTGGETIDSVLKGFTVRNGFVPGPQISSEGGGIWCATNTAAAIIDCVVADNTAWAGSGVMLRGTNSMSGCTIANNNSPDKHVSQQLCRWDLLHWQFNCFQL